MTGKGARCGQFYGDGYRLAQWAQEPELLLYGYWFWDWADSYERVERIDPQTGLITLSKPWHTYGFSVGAPFYAINALSELDAPGEWYLDRRGGRFCSIRHPFLSRRSRRYLCSRTG